MPLSLNFWKNVVVLHWHAVRIICHGVCNEKFNFCIIWNHLRTHEGKQICTTMAEGKWKCTKTEAQRLNRIFCRATCGHTEKLRFSSLMFFISKAKLELRLKTPLRLADLDENNGNKLPKSKHRRPEQSNVRSSKNWMSKVGKLDLRGGNKWWKLLKLCGQAYRSRMEIPQPISLMFYAWWWVPWAKQET